MTDFYAAKAEELAGIERSFTFAGVEFRIKPVMPADAAADLAEIQMDRLADNYYDTIVSIVRRSLRPEYRSRWDDLLAAEREVPITLEVLAQLVAELSNEEARMLEERTGRPTQPSSPSGSTGENGSTKSTDVSESREEVASMVSRSVPT
jgi:hypothetical protein